MVHTTSAYQGMTPHPDGTVHARLPMADVHRVKGNVDLPLPGVVKCAKPTAYHIPTMSHVASAPRGLHIPPAAHHHAGGPAPRTKTTYGMIGLERR